MMGELIITARVTLPERFKAYYCKNCVTSFIISSIEKIDWCPVCADRQIEETEKKGEE